MTIFPKLTIVIPVFNDFERLRQCLSALMVQPEMAVGLATCIVVDNGSVESIQPLEKEFPQVDFIVETTKGSYAARNAGAGAATGEYLAFVDSDCIPNEDYLRAAIQVTEQHPDVDMHVGEVALFPEVVDGVLADERVAAYEIATAFRQKHYANRVKFGPTANLLVRTAAFTKLGGFDQNLLSGGDKEFGQRAVRLGHKLRYSPECVVRHPTRSKLSELAHKTRRVVGGDHRLANSFRKTISDFARYLVLRPGNSLRLIWSSDKLSLKQRLLASETAIRVVGWQVSERFRLLRGGEARR